MKPHLQTCGTAYRGCDPNCPKELEEQAEEVARLRRERNRALDDLPVEGEIRRMRDDLAKMRADRDGFANAMDLELRRLGQIAKALGVTDYIDSVGPLLDAIDGLRAERDEARAERDELRAKWEGEMEARAKSRAKFAHAGEMYPEFVERMATERDAALAEVERWRNEATLYAVERDEARSQRAAILAEAREAEMQLRVGITRAKMAAYRARRVAEETEALVFPIDEACAHRIRAMLDGPELLTEGKRILAERDALRSERDEARAELALAIRQRDTARIALEDLANGRAEVQCLVGAPHEAGRHCQVHKGGTGECDACRAARRVERTTAVGERLAEAVVDMRSAVVALSGGNVHESLGVRINAANEVLRAWDACDGEVG